MKIARSLFFLVFVVVAGVTSATAQVMLLTIVVFIAMSYVVHVLAPPDRLEKRIGEAEDEEVLHGLLSQVVVDPEDLRLVEC